MNLKTLGRWTALSVATLAPLLPTSFPRAESASAMAAAPPLKVALIAPSGRGDHAFTQSMYAALQSLERRYHFRLTVSENQFVAGEAGRLMRAYAAAGYRLIIAHGSQYGAMVRQVAATYPDVSFAWGTASSTFGLRNVYAYAAKSNQGGYVQGTMAALLSRTKVVGEIGPVAVGDAKLYVDGFRAGARATDPKIVVHAGYTGSFSDPSLMAQRAEEFVNARADVLTGSSQAVIGALAVCRDRNALWFGTQWSQAALAPARVVSSQVYDWRVVLRKILNDVIAGRLGGRALSITLRNHGESITFNPRYPLPPAVRAAARKTIVAIENGRIAVPQ